MATIVLAGTPNPPRGSTLVVVVAETTHIDTQGPRTVARLLALFDRSGMHIECAFFEVPSDVDLSACGPSGCPGKTASLRAVQHAMTSDVLRALGRSATRAYGMDRTRDELRALYGEDGNPVAYTPFRLYETIIGRTFSFFDVVRHTGCARSIVLVGRAHVDSEPSLQTLLSDGGSFTIVTVVDASLFSGNVGSARLLDALVASTGPTRPERTR